jgi:hypothetical protein
MHTPANSLSTHEEESMLLLLLLLLFPIVVGGAGMGAESPTGCAVEAPEDTALALSTDTPWGGWGALVPGTVCWLMRGDV